jgi:hypothetical protein
MDEKQKLETRRQILHAAILGYNLNAAGRQSHAIFTCNWRPVACKATSLLQACCKNNDLNLKSKEAI